MEIYRGDIFFINSYNNNYGSEQNSGRPAVIVSNNSCNTHSNVVEIVYLTTQDKKPLPTHVPVMCQVPSTALCEAVYSVSVDRLGDFYRSVSTSEMQAIDAALKVSLGLEDTDNSAEKQAMLAHIEYLEKQLKEAEAKTEEKHNEIQKLKTNALLNTTKQNDSISPVEFAVLQTERNTYKEMYEKLLHKVLE